MTNDADRIAYLAGEEVASLDAPERAELNALRGVLGDSATWAEPGESLEQKVVAVVSERAGSRRHRRPLTLPEWIARRRLVFAAAATGLAAAVAVVIAVSGGSGPAASQRFAMVVTGTTLAPRAHGSATLTKTASGWRIELSATGLPHLADGRYYQAWLKNRAGILVPVGTFNDARKVTLWSGVPVTQFQTLTVTQQQANGNLASSGRRVLVGTIH